MRGWDAQTQSCKKFNMCQVLGFRQLEHVNYCHMSYTIFGMFLFLSVFTTHVAGVASQTGAHSPVGSSHVEPNLLVSKVLLWFW